MNTLNLAGYALMTVAVAGAGGVLFARNLFYAAVCLLMVVLSVAGLYVLMNAEFVGVTQILVYAGGILTLLLFGIMLTANRRDKPLLVENNKWLAGLLAVLPVVFVLVSLFLQHDFPIEMDYSKAVGNLPLIGILLMTDYLIAFEISGILLLMALIGAVVTASTRNTP